VTTLSAAAGPLVVMIASLASSRGLGAQDGLRVPRFEIAESALTLRTDARAQQYLGVVGRRAAWLGTETGPAELWVHPYKLADDFQLSFRIPEYLEPVRGVDLARRVEIRPAVTTITYTHATFTVRQHILAPVDDAGLLVLLDVRTLRPLEIGVSFRMVFQYAWPAAFGGQYTFWDANLRAFILSESRRQQNAVIGSPWASVASDHPAHALPDAPNTFVIPVDTARARTEFIPVAIAAGTGPRDSVLAIYRRLIAGAREVYRAREDHARRLLDAVTAIDTPDDSLDLALAWSALALDEQMVCNPDLGCGLVAGWGRSGRSTRPGFGWFFGGDAAINSLAMDAIGLWPQVAEGLRFLARYQRADGKITHEISQAAGRLPWFTDFPYAYYHADTTPYWILAVWRYWRASGDDALLADLWPAVEKAYAWCKTVETDGDGIIENTTGGLGAIEVGSIGEGIHQDIYLASVWIEALAAMQDMASVRERRPVADEAARLRATALATLNRTYWREAEGHHAFGILRSGGTNNTLTVWPATAAAFNALDAERGRRTLAKLASDAVSADWGARMLSAASPLYDPMHYNMGAVWPFVTGFVIWGQYNYQRPWAGYPLLDALKQLTFHWAPGRHPELLSGRFYRPLDTAVPHQFFATSMLVSPLVYGLLGWEPDAPRKRAVLAPQLPPSWSRVGVKRLRVGGSAVAAEIEQAAGRQVIRLSATGGPVDVILVPMLPAGASAARLTLDGVARETTEQPGPPGAERRGLVAAVGDTPRTVEITWRGGLAVEPPAVALTPGQESEGLRVLDFQPAGGGWLLDLEGAPGRAYVVALYGAPVRAVVASGGASVSFAGREGARAAFDVRFPAGVGRQAVSVRLTPGEPERAR
jgi:glycogen debranching enzyme